MSGTLGGESGRVEDGLELGNEQLELRGGSWVCSAKKWRVRAACGWSLPESSIANGWTSASYREVLRKAASLAALPGSTALRKTSSA